MTHRYLIASLLCATALLSGCGGGSGGNIASTPTPQVAVPTPAPEFANASSTYVTVGASAPKFGQSITYDPDSQTYTVGATTLGPDTSSISSDFRTYFKKDSNAYDAEHRWVVLRSGSDGENNTRIRLSHLSYALYSYSDNTYGNSDDIIVSGTPTASSDMPRTGAATYTGIVDGYYRSPQNGQQRLLDSTGTLTADFANGTISTQLALRTSGQEPSGASSSTTGTVIGTLTGSGTIGSGTNNYQGTLAGSLQGTAVNGSLNGLFFGPGATETGFAFGVNSTRADSTNRFPEKNVSAHGAFVGRQ